MILIVFLILLIAVGVFSVLNFWSGKRTDTPATEPEVPYVDPLPNDTDRDGISNEEEAALGLNASEFDTDGDAISDKDELDVWKTDPKNVDTDGDGVRDGVEIVTGSDPLKK